MHFLLLNNSLLQKRQNIQKAIRVLFKTQCSSTTFQQRTVSK